MLFTRFDGTRARDLPALRRMMPFVMVGRTESAVYFEQVIDLTRTLPWIERFNAAHEHRVTVFHVLLGAMVRTYADRPRLNRFISGRRIWDRKGIWLAFSAKKRMDDHAPLTTVKLPFEPDEPFEDMVTRLAETLGEARSDRPSSVEKEVSLLLKLPTFILGLAVALVRLLDSVNLAPRALIGHDPMFASAFIASLGSLKIDAAYHHLYEYGNCPLFVTIGKIEDIPVVGEDGAIEARRVMRLKYSYDERIEDGLYCARALELLKDRIEDPGSWAE